MGATTFATTSYDARAFQFTLTQPRQSRGFAVFLVAVHQVAPVHGPGIHAGVCPGIHAGAGRPST